MQKKENKVLEVVEKQKFGVYVFKNEKTGKNVKLIFQFYGIDLDVGDKLIIQSQLLNRRYSGFSQPYTFEKVTKNLKEVSENTSKNDLGVINKNGKEYLVKRVYG